jgi:mono/diheme cytochrome c family protein
MQSQKRFVTLASGLVFAPCALMTLAGCHVQPALTPQQAEGKRLYDAGCAHCHEENDLHLNKVPPNLHDMFSRATLPSGAPATDAEVERVMMTGKGMMPSFAYQMNSEQVAALLAYLHTGMQDEHQP